MFGRCRKSRENIHFQENNNDMETEKKVQGRYINFPISNMRHQIHREDNTNSSSTTPTNSTSNHCLVSKLRHYSYSIVILVMSTLICILASYYFEQIVNKKFPEVSHQFNFGMKVTDTDLIRKYDSVLSNIYMELKQLKSETKLLQNENMYLKHAINNFKDLQTNVSFCLSDDHTKRLVEKVLQTHEAEKIGQTDFALESSGAHLISTDAVIDSKKKVTVFGIPLFDLNSEPRIILQNNVIPGNCFSFKGSSAKIRIQLAATIRVSSFTIEHIPREVAIDITSAPKDFKIIAIAEDELINLGNFTYNLNGPPRQIFDCAGVGCVYPYRKIQLEIINNHGNDWNTCIYKFGVHGRVFGEGN